MATKKQMTLKDLLILKLQQLQDTEEQLVVALPKMAEMATDPELKSTFEKHLEQTRLQLDTLVSVFAELEVPAKAAKCEGIRGIIEDAEWQMKKIPQGAVLDASLSACAQDVEHYEMIGYGTATEWATVIGMENVASLLDKILTEETEAADLLLQMSVTRLNTVAQEEETEA